MKERMNIMTTEQKLAVMQNTYAASVAETVNTYDKLKVLEYIVDKKKERLPDTAATVNAQLGVQTPADVFVRMSEVFECADWKVHENTDGFTAVASSCKLCALCKRMGGANPCNGWCLNPMRAMVQAVGGSLDFTVASTLMSGQCCRVDVSAKTT
jgi:hypothetical protein